MAEIFPNEPKIVFFDLETLPNLDEVMRHFTGLSAYPGRTLKSQLNSIICFGYKIQGDKKAKCINAWDFKEWKKDVNNDKPLLEKAYEILHDADAVVTHNGKRFDWKVIQTRLLKNKMPLLPKIKHIDTCQLAKSNLFMLNNRLNNLAKEFTDTSKLENGGWDLWCKVLKRHKPSMNLMAKYCKQDVEVLHEIFKLLKPLANNIPNYNLFGTHFKKLCPSCGSTRFHGHGRRATKTKIQQRYKCYDCGSFFHMNMKKELPRSE